MPNEALILVNRREFTVAFTETAIALKTAALEKAALIAKVKTREEQELAIAALRDLKRVTDDAEKARKACKEPVIKFGKDIDGSARVYVNEPAAEIDRLNYLVSEFQRLERIRIEAEQRAADETRKALDREKQAAIAQAATIEQIDDIREEFSRKEAAVVQEPTPIAKVQGQSVGEEWEIEVFDIWLLAKAHPACVSITERVGEIKSLLKAGVDVKGVRAKKVIKNRVQASKDVPAINV